MTNGAHKDPAKHQKHTKGKEERSDKQPKPQVKNGIKKEGQEGN